MLKPTTIIVYPLAVAYFFLKCFISEVVGAVLFPQQQFATIFRGLKHAFLILYITNNMLQKISDGW